MGEFSFTSLMELEPLGDDRFRAPLSPEVAGNMFGGQLLSQGLMAAQATVGEREAHSLHTYFLRPGEVDVPMELAVERVRDGRSFNARSVSGWQGHRELFRLLVSYHVAEPGAKYSGATMPSVPPPEDVTTTYADFHHEASGNDQFVVLRESRRAWDIRYVNPPTAPIGEPVTDDQRMWMRFHEKFAERPGLQRAALAYLSDATLIDHIALPHGLRWEMAQVSGTSLDHAMWFLRAPSADEWLLFDQHVESTGGARGVVSGRFFTRDGELIAVCCQEGLVRWVEPDEP